MTRTHHPLDAIPHGATAHGVTAAAVSPDRADGRAAVQVELLDELAVHGEPGIDYIDQPTFLIIPAAFATGSVSVDIWSELNTAPYPEARGFAGLAYHISRDRTAFESVYLRPLNGHKVDPPPPRHHRAVQYFAYPDWPFDRLRTEHPDGAYETGADIGPREWITLQVAVTTTVVSVAVNGHHVLTVDQPKPGPPCGDLGLFVDIGTRAYFSNLTVET